MGDNRKALERALKALEGLTVEHDALVQHARTLADQIDSGGTDSKLHGEYRQVCKALLEVGRKRDIDDFEKLLRAIASGE